MGDTTDTSGLGNLLGGLSGAASSGVTGAASAVGSAMVGAGDLPPLPERPNRVASTPAYSDTLADQGKRTTVWPWVVAAAVVAGLLFFFLGGNETDTDTIATTNDTTAASVQDATAVLDSTATSTGPLVDSASTAISAAADSMAKALAASAAALGTFAPKKLPDGIELNIPANGIENKLIAFIDDPAKMVDQTTWFNFDRVQYETGSAKLKPESREQLQNIAAILKAYPAIALKVGGYTDNTGNAAANKTLSQSRAEAAVAELVRLGVDPARLEAEGYGQGHPVASNKTDEGRAQNRRMAVRVTKK
ncbi:OmpA family protein [Fibrella aestuarina]|uniref:OmpA family protein n=2 Tax=Fibrivirga algicola TaxID=2950420 RepID=A0ABX0QFF0_9BACT|nr:OmpA family protein [Fibrivirga algicola]